MSERITPDDLTFVAETIDLRVDEDSPLPVWMAQDIAVDLRRAADTIAALEREAKPVKFRWEATDNLPYQRLRDGYAGNLRVGKVLSVRDGEWFWELRNQMGWAGVEQSEDEAKAALEDEILKQLRGGE